MRTYKTTARVTALLTGLTVASPSTGEAQAGATGAAPQAAATVPAINGKLRTIRLYESGDEPLASADRVFATTFEKARTRRIGTELTFDFPAPGRVVAFRVECSYAAADSTLGTFEIPFELQADWTSAFNGVSWGWAGPGNWKAGSYRVACTSDGVRIGGTQFEIADGPPDLPSFNAKLTRMRLFAGGSEMMPREQRTFGTRFVGAEVQYLNVEIELAHPAPGRAVKVPINCLFIRGDGTIAATVDLTFDGIQADWTSSVRAGGWGAAAAGAFWKPGKYRVACTGDGRLIGQLAFEVT